MAPIVHEAGQVTAAAPGSGVLVLQKGRTMPERTSLKINPASEIGFTPFPGSSVLVTENSQTTIEKMEFVREGDEVKKRAATLRLEAGRLFYSIEKFQPEVTKFEVITPDRVVAVRVKVAKPGGTDVAGVVEILGQSLLVTAVSGAVEVSGQDGKSVTINEGSIYTGSGNTAQILNLVSRQITVLDASGNVLESRAASASELVAARAGFQTVMAVAEQAVIANALSGELVAAITRTLVEVNSSLAANGLNAITTTAVGTTGTPVAPVAPPTYQLPGMSGAETANPANTSGVVRSGER